MKSGQLQKYSMINIFLKKYGEETSPKPFLKNQN